MKPEQLTTSFALGKKQTEVLCRTVYLDTECLTAAPEMLNAIPSSSTWEAPCCAGVELDHCCCRGWNVQSRGIPSCSLKVHCSGGLDCPQCSQLTHIFSVHMTKERIGLYLEWLGWKGSWGKCGMVLRKKGERWTDGGSIWSFKTPVQSPLVIDTWMLKSLARWSLCVIASAELLLWGSCCSVNCCLLGVRCYYLGELCTWGSEMCLCCCHLICSPSAWTWSLPTTFSLKLWPSLMGCSIIQL